MEHPIILQRYILMRLSSPHQLCCASPPYGTDLRVETAPRSDQEAAEQQHRERPEGNPYPEAIALVVPDAGRQFIPQAM